MGDRYVLGFAPAPWLLRSQILCRHYTSLSDETINQGPPCVYTYKKITSVWIMETLKKIPQQHTFEAGDRVESSRMPLQVSHQQPSVLKHRTLKNGRGNNNNTHTQNPTTLKWNRKKYGRYSSNNKFWSLPKSGMQQAFHCLASVVDRVSFEGN